MGHRSVQPSPVGWNTTTHLFTEEEAWFTPSPSDFTRRPETTIMKKNKSRFIFKTNNCLLKSNLARWLKIDLCWCAGLVLFIK